MAKYCFYCGRELASGEKCSCRGKRERNTSASSQTQQEKTKAKKSGAQKTKKQSRAKKDKDTIKSRRAKIRRSEFRLRTLSDQVRTLFPNLSRGAVSGVGYLFRPATKIRQESLKMKRPFSIFTISFFSLITGVLSIVLVRSESPLFLNILNLIFSDAVRYLYTHPLISMLLVSFFSLLIIITMSFLFFIAARLSNRKPSFLKALDLVSISLFYVIILEIFLLLSVLLGFQGSFSIIFVSIILMGITQLLSFRNALGLTEDSIFLILVFVYMGTYILTKLYLFIVMNILGVFSIV